MLTYSDSGIRNACIRDSVGESQYLMINTEIFDATETYLIASVLQIDDGIVVVFML